MSSNDSHRSSQGILGHLHPVLSDLSGNPYPYVPNPPNCKKRASVALIIRIQPHSSHWPPDQDDGTRLGYSIQDQLKAFFANSWVQNGDPEVLFIKRAARSGDRWTSHVAFPGGRREESDEDDKAAAIRETFEEVGLDLKNAIHVGNLPQKVVTTSWGQTPLMILCPYIFLLTSHAIPPLKLQPSEVGSTHWVSLRALLSPSLRTYEHADVSDRLARQGDHLARFFLRLMLGQMRFAAIRLLPSESIYCSSAPAFLPNDSSKTTLQTPSSNESILSKAKQALQTWWLSDHAGSANLDRPLLLWGLTLGILADFLDLLPQYQALRFWSYPTFTPLDVRFWVWICSFTFRRRKLKELATREKDRLLIPPPAVEEGLDSIAVPKVAHDSSNTASRTDYGSTKNDQDTSCVRTYYGSIRPNQKPSRSSTVGVLLEGYWVVIRRAVVLALIARVVVGIVVVWRLLRWYRRRGRC
ncbi:MAG: hypothetical protein M1812_005303 [Candelaria pacifica]|nr:MAG: hypothetical protein M1812_005303 [Candelaria pacifica]